MAFSCLLAMQPLPEASWVLSREATTLPGSPQFWHAIPGQSCPKPDDRHPQSLATL